MICVARSAGRGAPQRLTTAGLETPVIVVNDMAAIYGWADVVVCRSGALTVSELAAAGVGSVLIPYPFAVDDHQTANGRYLSEAGAALLFSQQGLTAATLADALLPLMNRDALLSMAQKARARAQPESTDTVVAACLRGGK